MKKNRSASKKNKDKSQSRSSSKIKDSKKGLLNLSQQISDMKDFDENILDINIGKPRSSYSLFTQDIFAKDFKGENMIDVIPQIAKKWKKFSDKEREKYDEMADEEKARYEEHLALVRKHLIAKPPKESATAYLIYMDVATKKAIENLEDVKEARVKAREEWNNMSKREKEKWEEKKEENRELYEKLKNTKPGNVTGYALWVKDQIAAAREKGQSITITDCADKWPKVKASTKEKYNDYAMELKGEKEKQRDLYELTFGVKPRRPLGPYNFFIQEMAKMKKYSGSNFFKECSKAWKKLSDDEMEKYEKLAKRSQLIYTVKKRAFNDYKKTTFKKAPSAFNFYLADMREKITGKDLDNKGAFEYISQKWKKESDAVKKKYKKKADEAERDNAEAKDDYLHSVYVKPKRQSTGYQLFLADRMPELKEKYDKPTTELMKMIAEEWQGLKDSQKAKWNEKALPGQEAYKTKMKEFERNGFYIMDKEEREMKSMKKEERSQRAKSPLKSKSLKKRKKD